MNNIDSQLRIRVVQTSSMYDDKLLAKNLTYLESKGVKILFEPIQLDYIKGITKESSQKKKAEALTKALLEPESNGILSCRGGYGASDLLKYLDWTQLEKSPKKLLAGFSDVSALHSGIYERLKWPSIHGTMPSFNKCGLDNDYSYLDLVLEVFSSRTGEYSLPIEKLFAESHSEDLALTGTVFGGCFTVLTSLIGTPYFPKDLSSHILFFEDIGENYGKLMRGLNQWELSGAFKGVKAVVLGKFVDSGEDIESLWGRVIYERFKIPVYRSSYFGHIFQNRPLIIGKNAKIRGDELIWNLEELSN